MRLSAFMAAAALLSAGLAAHADVIYTYVAGSSGTFAGSSFLVDSSSFLSYSTNRVAVTSGELVLEGTDYGKAIDVEFVDSGLVAEYAATAASGVFGGQPGYNIAVDGVYHDNQGDTLTISGSPTAASVTPEPSTFTLLGTGLLGVAGVVRRRLA